MATAVQANAARHIANEVRLGHADLCRDLRKLPRPEARFIVAELVRDPDNRAARMPIEKLLMACPGFGPVRVDMTLELAGIRTGKLRLADMSQERRELLATAMTDTVRLPARETEILEEIVEERDTLRCQISSLRLQLRRLRGELT